ncbi:clathrin interactor EPSIN 2 [Argentina anserina]|uniref:clathrin interactor EPSIN 2 n=1 Tax=Argentina anserina TaxID=57926 RepID=UPI0021767842|nr:clathrin interactor EPSIN 2 [Potentilla anserina]
MKKAFDQTVRDLKRGVNKKVLKVPGIEQKVLDATSNEPWGPHGSLLADIAQATRNYHDYQMIMSVIWKRLSDTGKNWRHVYKGLTVLEYMVAHGSERVIDDIKEHAYQISTLSEFQYIDSSGRDQGSNVRKKSQSLVALVNDKERIIEVRQKAAANRDKFRSTPSSGGLYRPGSYTDRYEDDRYGGRDEDRNGYGYGKDREWGYKDDDRYGRSGDSYSRDGDRYGREYDEQNGREGYRDDDYRGRSRSVDGDQYGSRSRSSDRERERAYDDDGQYSSRGSGARADDQSQDGRLSRKFSEQNIAPPSYEEAVSETRSPVHSERDAEPPAVSAPRASSPPTTSYPSQTTTFQAPSAPGGSSPPASFAPSQANSAPSGLPVEQVPESFDEFDPRGSVSGGPFGSVSAAPTTSNNAEMDLFGSLSESFSSNSLAIVPTTSATTTSEVDGLVNSVPVTTYMATPPAANVMNQSFEDPFGESPFRALPSTEVVQSQPQTSTSADSFPPSTNQGADTVSNFPFGDSFSALTYSAPGVSTVQTPANSHFLPQDPTTEHQNTDILADILPPSGATQPSFPGSAGQPSQPTANMYGNFQPQPGSMVPQTQTGFSGQHSGGAFPSQGGPTTPVTSQVAPQMPAGQSPQYNNGNFMSQQGGYAGPNNGNYYSQQGGPYMAPQTTGPVAQYGGGGYASQVSHQAPAGPPSPAHNLPQGGSGTLTSTTGALALVDQPPKDNKFETKSAVWADTLSRGLVNLNISGAKINPLNDIGIDFDAINRKEKRMEKQPATSATSAISMGKAMGSGSGMGRAGAGVLRAPANPMVGSGMGMGMGPGMGMGMGMGMGRGGGMGMGGYGGMNQPMGAGMGMGMNMGMNMGMGMNVGMGMQPPTGLPPGSNVPSGYNPMMGQGGYPQQPYGGYR